MPEIAELRLAQASARKWTLAAVVLSLLLGFWVRTPGILIALKLPMIDIATKLGVGYGIIFGIPVLVIVSAGALYHLHRAARLRRWLLRNAGDKLTADDAAALTGGLMLPSMGETKPSFPALALIVGAWLLPVVAAFVIDDTLSKMRRFELGVCLNPADMPYADIRAGAPRAVSAAECKALGAKCADTSWMLDRARWRERPWSEGFNSCYGSGELEKDPASFANWPWLYPAWTAVLAPALIVATIAIAMLNMFLQAAVADWGEISKLPPGRRPT